MPLQKISEEERASLSANDGGLVRVSPQEAAIVGVHLSGKPQLQSADPTEDFDAFYAQRKFLEKKGYNPGDQGIAESVYAPVKSFITDIAQAGGELIGSKIIETKETILGDKSEVDKELLSRAALISQSVAQLASDYSGIWDASKTAVKRIGNYVQRKLENDPAKLAELDRHDARLVFDFLKQRKEDQQVVHNFNSLVEDWTGVTGFGNIPVNQEAAQGIASAIDPANYVPVGSGARMLKIPQSGAVKAAEFAKSAAFHAATKASADLTALKIAVDSAEDLASKKVSEEAYNAASVIAKEAADNFKVKESAFNGLVERQAEEIAAQTGSRTRQAASGAAQYVGSKLDQTGKYLKLASEYPEKVTDFFIKRGDVDASSATNGVIREKVLSFAKNGLGLGGTIPGALAISGEVAQGGGKVLNTLGKLWMDGQSQIPFFRRLANDTQGITAFAASMADNTGIGGLMESGGRMILSSAPAAAMGSVPSAIQTVAADQPWTSALGGTVGGGLLGMAGAAVGEWRRYSDPNVFRAQQVNDVNRFYGTIKDVPELRAYFDNLPRAEKNAIATYSQAYPDAQIRFSRLGNAEDGRFYTDDQGHAIVEVNMDSKTPVSSILAHEIGHHIEAHGLSPYVKRELLGDEATGNTGIFTEVKEGKLVPTTEFERLKEQYNDRLRSQSTATGDPYVPADNAQIAKEIFAEYAAGQLLDTKAFQRKRQNFASDKLLEAFADSSIVRNVGFLQGALAKMGVPFAKDGSVVGTGLFDNIKNSKELTKLVDNYNRTLYRQAKADINAEDASLDVVYTPEQVDSKVANIFKSSSDIKVDPKTRKIVVGIDGKPEFNSKIDIENINKEIGSILSKYIQENPRQNSGNMRYYDDGKSFYYEGKFLPDGAIKKLEESGRFNPFQMDNLRRINDILQSGSGASVSMLYQPRTKSGSGKRYRTLKAKYMTVVPYGVRFTKDGNVTIQSFSPEQFSKNVDKAIKQRRLTLWNNNRGMVYADLKTYLRNHAEGRSGDAVIGEAKKNMLNELFGVRVKEAAGRNPVFEDIYRPNKEGTIRTPRLDGINRLHFIDGEDYIFDYGKVKFNLRPSGAAQVGLERSGEPNNVVAR